MKKNYLLIVISFLLFILIICYGIYNFSSNKIKLKDKSKDIIYDISEYSSYKQNVPYVNLVGSDIDLINDNISLFIKDYYGNQNISIGYDYYKSGTIISILVTIIDKNTIGVPEVLFTNYFISLKDNTIISNEEILNMMSLDSDIVKDMVSATFLDFYNSNDIHNYCDDKCFKDSLNSYYDFDRDVSFLLINGEVRAYISIHEKMEFVEYQYFEDKDFYIKVGDFNV